MGQKLEQNNVESYSFLKCAIIVVALTLLDSVGCIVLLVGTIIYTKKGQHGLAMALCIANCVVPDVMPAVDEIFNIIVFAVPAYIRYEKTGSIFESIKAGAESYKGYKGEKDQKKLK